MSIARQKGRYYKILIVGGRVMELFISFLQILILILSLIKIIIEIKLIVKKTTKKERSAKRSNK